MDSPTQTNTSPTTTGDLTKLAARRLTSSFRRRAGVAWAAAARWVRSHRRVALAAVAAPALAFTAVHTATRPSVDGSVPEGSSRDLVTFLVQSRQNDRLGAGPREALLHARAALALGEYTEMLEALELALKAEPKLADDEEFLKLALQSFNAGRTMRTQALLQRAERKRVEPVLQAATSDYSYRIRHGAADQLKLLGVAVADPVPMMLLDVWQLDRCDARRSAANRLLAAARGDARVTAGLEAAARRPADDGCLKGVVAVSSR